MHCDKFEFLTTFINYSSNPRALLFFSPDPLHSTSPPRHRHPFPVGNPAKLGDFSLFSCLRTPSKPRNSPSLLEIPDLRCLLSFVRRPLLVWV
ncbi:hypothetical protein SLEP1_g51114 [Rubroshorea leprosula]|uniref:Uncharacterized protein n=1 Tax=Rubroshorea leprosula TaxID=152421 RepID=A0AAV5M244_9ROSI|nr:hypothetical protein SLEP1_g51114 [Rubroshorea leprosula]